MLEEAVWKQFLHEVETYSMDALKFRVNTAELNVRTGPGTNFTKKRKLFLNDVVTKAGQEGVWIKIGTDEWVHANYLLQV